METEFDPDFIEFLFTCFTSFILLIWIQIHPAQDIRRLLYIIKLVILKIIHLIGKCLLTVAEFFINQTGSLSNDEPIKIAGEDTQLNFLQLTLEDITILTNQLPFLATEEFEMARKWRNLSEEVTNLHIEYELGLKTSYTYLLLDPEISNNLPRRQNAIPLQEAWRTFIDSVFYVGKGSRSSRPFEHFYRAKEIYEEQNQDPNAPGTSRIINTYNNRYYRNIEPKIEHIISLWSKGRGPVIIRFSQDVMRHEALTREAIIIQTIGLENLIQEKAEQGYGPASQWEDSRIQRLGCYLLYLGFQVYLAEGEKEVLHVDLIQTRPKRPKTN